MEKTQNLFDTHCHLFDSRLASETSDLLNSAFDAGVNKILVIESDPEKWKSSIAFCEKHKNLFISCGIHPCMIPENLSFWLEKLLELTPQLDAIGEIGLDKYSNNTEQQIEAFERQVSIAADSQLPIVLHCRKEFSELYNILSCQPSLPPCVLHNYSGSAEQSAQFVKLGCFFSVGGVITYPNAKKIHTVLKAIPIDKILLETDSPDLPPDRYRGKINKPQYLPLIANAVANSLEIPQDELKKLTYENSMRFISEKSDNSPATFSDTPENLHRLSQLISAEKVHALQNKSVAIIGLGGVGSWAAEALARSGVGRIHLIDGDTVDKTNINRQLFSTFDTIGMNKAKVAEKRLRTLCHNSDISSEAVFLSANNLQILDRLKPDCVIDAIDSIQDKVDLLTYCVENSIPVVSSMGAGGKTNPQLISSADISKTHGCMLAKKLRKLLRDRNIHKGIKTVFSPQPALKPSIDKSTGSRVIGSAVWVTAVFGFYLSWEAVSILAELER